MEVGNVNSKHLVLALKVKEKEREGPWRFYFWIKDDVSHIMSFCAG
jgi:hypothetical protein